MANIKISDLTAASAATEAAVKSDIFIFAIV